MALFPALNETVWLDTPGSPPGALPVLEALDGALEQWRTGSYRWPEWEASADDCRAYREPALRSCSQAGLVNNLNDSLAWGLVPLYLAAHGASVGDIGLVAALYPGVWSVAQIATGHWSDRVGRKPLIVAGMLVQAAALTLLAASGGALVTAVAAAVLLGAGTALVYPTLIAAISDAVTPVARAPVVGVYRFWRDSGYVFGGLIAGIVADALGYGGAITLVAALTAASGLWVIYDMPSQRPSAAAAPRLAGSRGADAIAADTGARAEPIA